MNTKVSIVVPAYNEGRNIYEFLEELKRKLSAMSWSFEIIVVNDGSTDDTGDKARWCGVQVVDHKENKGYGRSLKDGILAAKGEYIFLMDADGTYDIDKMPEMLKMIERADLVVGKRIFSKEAIRNFKNIARRFFAYQVSYYSGTKVEDLNSGQRVFKRKDVIDELDKYPDGFSFTSTQTVLYILKGKKPVYLPVTYQHRGKSSKFVSRKQILSMAKLSLSLTFFGRPVKLILQLCLVFAGPLLVANIISGATGGQLLSCVIYYILILPLSIFLWFWHIYARGRAVV